MFGELLRPIQDWAQTFWPYAVDLVSEFFDHFKQLEPGFQVVWLLTALFCFAVVMLFIAMTASKAASPFRHIAAPIGYPERPPWFQFGKLHAYYISCRYISHCAPNAIGWFAPRLLIWIGSVGVFGCLVLKVWSFAGSKPIHDLTFALVFLALLTQATVVAYAHNTGRRAGLRRARVPFFKFLKVFALPLALTTSLVAFELLKHNLVPVGAWILQRLPLA